MSALGRSHLIGMPAVLQPGGPVQAWHIQPDHGLMAQGVLALVPVLELHRVPPRLAVKGAYPANVPAPHCRPEHLHLQFAAILFTICVVLTFCAARRCLSKGQGPSDTVVCATSATPTPPPSLWDGLALHTPRIEGKATALPGLWQWQPASIMTPLPGNLACNQQRKAHNLQLNLTDSGV